MAKTSGLTSSSNHASAGEGRPAATPLARAWVSVALVPVFFFLSFAAAEGISAQTGYDPTTGAASLWVDLAAALPFLAIVLIPCVAGVVYGRRALRAGVRAGLVPAVLAGLSGVGVMVLTFANL